MASEIFQYAWYQGASVKLEQIPHQPADDPQTPNLRGAFTTTRTWLSHDHIAFFDRHLARLKQTIRHLGVDPSGLAFPSSKELGGWIKSLSGDDMVLRINAAADGTIWVATRKLEGVGKPVRLFESQRRVDPQADDSGWKVFHQTWRRDSIGEALRQLRDDVILVSSDGYVLETSRSNIFFRINDEWVTPPDDGRILPGIARSVLMAEFAIIERPIAVDEARENATAGFVTNSVRGVQQILHVDRWPTRLEGHPEIEVFAGRMEKLSKHG